MVNQFSPNQTENKPLFSVVQQEALFNENKENIMNHNLMKTKIGTSLNSAIAQTVIRKDEFTNPIG